MAKITGSPEALIQSIQEGIALQQKVVAPDTFFPGMSDVVPDKFFHFSLEKRLELIEAILALSAR